MRNIFLILLMFGTTSLFGSYKTPYYIDKVSQFEHLKHDKELKVMMLGDSITDRCLWMELTNRYDIANRGISGDTTDGVLNRLQNTPDNISKVYIMIGVNDIIQGVRVEKVFKNHQKIISFFKSKKVDVVVESTLYVTKNFPSLNRKIQRLNNQLKEFCKKNSILYVDLNKKLSPNGYLQNRYTSDGLHLNIKGYLIWIKMIGL